MEEVVREGRVEVEVKVLLHDPSLEDAGLIVVVGIEESLEGVRVVGGWFQNKPQPSPSWLRSV